VSQPQPRDLMYTQEIKALVRDTYHAVASPAGAVARKLYPAEELAQVPQIAIDGALGVASPLGHAGIEPGDTVLDLGCGSGIDTILAARRIGPAGRVIALDFLPAMLDRTAEAAAQAGLPNVDTLHADIGAGNAQRRGAPGTAPGRTARLHRPAHRRCALRRRHQPRRQHVRERRFIVHFFDRALVDRLATGFTLLDLSAFEKGSLPRRLWRITLRREGAPRAIA
jgi:SAM-dependent methyltransferase